MSEFSFFVLAGLSVFLFVLPELLFAVDLARSPSKAGPDALIGATGRVVEAQSDVHETWVEVQGERWRAECHGTAATLGDEIRVLGVDGLRLVVAAAGPPGESDTAPKPWELPANPTRIAGGIFGCLAAIAALSGYGSLFPTLVIPLAVGAIWMLLGVFDG